MWITLNPDTLKMTWKESLETFSFSNITRLFLVSLRALKDMYKSLFYVWFLPTALLAGLILDSRALLCSFYVTLLLRAARPSIDLRKRDYWSLFNAVDWLLFFGLLMLVDGVHALFLSGTPSLFSMMLGKIYEALLKLIFLGKMLPWLPDYSLLGIVLYFLSPFTIIWVLFLLDSKVSVWDYVKATGRAFLMLFYNYPFFLISYMILRLFINIIIFIAHYFTATYPHLPLIGWATLFIFGIPFYLCFIMSFYVKKVHEQFGLYY